MEVRTLHISPRVTVANSDIDSFPGEFDIAPGEVAELIAVHYSLGIMAFAAAANYSFQFGLCASDAFVTEEPTVANFAYDPRLFGQAAIQGQGYEATAVGYSNVHVVLPIIVPLYGQLHGKKIWLAVQNQLDGSAGPVAVIHYRPLKVPLQRALTLHRTGP